MGISMWQLLILLLIVVLVFGTKRLRNIGSDLGGAVKGFRKGLEDDSQDNEPEKLTSAENTSAAPQSSEEKESAKNSTD